MAFPTKSHVSRRSNGSTPFVLDIPRFPRPFNINRNFILFSSLYLCLTVIVIIIVIMHDISDWVSPISSIDRFKSIRPGYSSISASHRYRSKFYIFFSLHSGLIIIVCLIMRLLIVLVMIKFDYAIVAAVFFSLIFSILFLRKESVPPYLPPIKILYLFSQLILSCFYSQ